METFEIMWAYLLDLVYGILEVFGITRDEEGNLVKKEEA